MNTLNFETEGITTLILIKEDAVISNEIIKHYVEPLELKGLNEINIATHGLLYEGNKIKAALGKAYLKTLLPRLAVHKKLKSIIVADSNYFKWLTKQTKVTDAYGEVFHGELEGYEDYKIVLVPNYKSLFYNPDNVNLINEGITAITGLKKPNIIHSAEYIKNKSELGDIFSRLHSYPALTIDIETTGLNLGIDILSIAFAWDKHNGVCLYIKSIGTVELTKFFETYKGEMIFHNALFDCKHLIYNLFMNKSTSVEGRQKGVDIFEDVEDSMLYAYIAKNSTTEAKLDLKSNALEFAGNYGIDVKDAGSLPVSKLMKYNLKDCLATWFVYTKYKQITIDENLLEPYVKIFQPSIKVLLKMMLTGLPLDNTTVLKVEKELQDKHDNHFTAIKKYSEIEVFNHQFRLSTMVDTNSRLIRKCKPFSDFMGLEFNPKSNNNIRTLFYEQLGYAPIDLTDTKQPATGAKTLAKLVNVAKQDSHKELLEHLIGISQTSKILGTFIKAFKNYSIEGFLHGNLKLGGTQSGRLASNSPNLQNLPSNSMYGKAIKSCFRAPDGWLWAGADFSSLEDRINAILTKDPNKIKVYTDGYDGHSLRAFSYFRDEMPDIVDTVASINSIEAKYPKLRQKSKAPTFALTYNGTWHTLVTNIGFSKDEAKQIEDNYHKLYKVSDKFTQANVMFAEDNGYMECAFGLRIKCPILAKTIHDNSLTPYAATAEARSANNAVTQSWGMLINRALIATNKLIEDSEFSYHIHPINTIHDAAYFLVKDTPEAIKFLNDTLIKEMQWNEHPLISSKEVPMAADLEIGKSWDKQTSLPNGASIKQIEELLSTLGG